MNELKFKINKGCFSASIRSYYQELFHLLYKSYCIQPFQNYELKRLSNLFNVNNICLYQGRFFFLCMKL